jgi:hypothetical protein
VYALLNRLWLTDRLAAGGVAARHRLMLSICVEIGIGLAIVCAAAFLASTTPAVQATPRYFLAVVGQVLLPALQTRPDSLVVMDNLTSHKVPRRAWPHGAG